MYMSAFFQNSHIFPFFFWQTSLSQTLVLVVESLRLFCFKVVVVFVLDSFELFYFEVEVVNCLKSVEVASLAMVAS